MSYHLDGAQCDVVSLDVSLALPVRLNTMQKLNLADRRLDYRNVFRVKFEVQNKNASLQKQP